MGLMSKKKKEKKWRWLTVKQKFILSTVLSLIWLGLIAFINVPWIIKLSQHMPIFFAAFIISIIAIIPSFWYAFTLISFLSDSRPEYYALEHYPGVSVLVAAYNEEDIILETMESLSKQKYPGNLEIIIINDGSTDKTLSQLNTLNLNNLIVITVPHGGKAAALNAGLEKSQYELLVSIDADTYLLPDSITLIVDHIEAQPSDVGAVAGTVCVRNSRNNLLTKIQEWNYFNEFISQKRIQSLFQTTLVAQGAFSIYRKKAVVQAGKWPKSVGEDIVLTWAMIQEGYRIGFAESAFAFTNVPVTYRKLFLQRSRWSQGMLEALSAHHQLLFRKQFTTLFIWWNLLIPLIDCGYGLIFLPGVIAAFFGYFFIAGPMTISVIPLILLNNFVFFMANRKEFEKRNLMVRKNVWGYVVFMFLYQALIMVPAAIYGYFTYVLGKRKWGTKK